jgi:hypothetical protein
VLNREGFPARGVDFITHSSSSKILLNITPLWNLFGRHIPNQCQKMLLVKDERDFQDEVREGKTSKKPQ